MLRIVLAILSVVPALSVGAEIDYCTADLCPAGVKHIACQDDGKWGAKCPASPAPVIVQLDLDLRQHVVRLHNVRRNKLALGQLANFKPARRMATTRWSPQMAELAAINVRQCLMKHDACHNTKKFRSSGQNLALISYSGNAGSRTVQNLLTSSINLWWNEHQNANMAVINSFPQTWKGGEIGHFTCMANDNNWAVGCSAARYVQKGMNNFLLACNYATTNTVGKAVYVRGPTASGCTTGTQGNFAGLCNVAETYKL